MAGQSVGDLLVLDEASGLSKIVVRAAPDRLRDCTVKRGAKVWLHFRGTHSLSRDDGTVERAGGLPVFDDTYARHSPFTTTVGKEETIAGLERALESMREGERALVICPPSLGFGAVGNPMGFHGCGVPIPGGAWLFFDAELLVTSTTNEALTDAQAFKDEGNRRYAEGLWAAASFMYSRGLELVKQQAQPNAELKLALTSNLMLSCLKEDDYENARHIGLEYLADKQTAVDSVKLLSRLGEACIKLRRWTDAEEHLARAQQLATDAATRAAVQRQAAVVAAQLAALRAKEQTQFAGMFDRLADADAAPLYTPTDIAERQEHERQERLRECPFCHEKVDAVQYARHVIKFHGDKK